MIGKMRSKDTQCSSRTLLNDRLVVSNLRQENTHGRLVERTALGTKAYQELLEDFETL
jgi:hypothetical protein